MHTPLERLLGETPDYTFFKVFGCACWPNIRPYNNRKLQFRSKQCVFLGYSSQHTKDTHVFTYLPIGLIFPVMLYLMSLFFPYSQIPSDSTLPSTSTLPLRSDQFVDTCSFG
jgi:histone deacetylase 1/2